MKRFRMMYAASCHFSERAVHKCRATRPKLTVKNSAECGTRDTRAGGAGRAADRTQLPSPQMLHQARWFVSDHLHKWPGFVLAAAHAISSDPGAPFAVFCAKVWLSIVNLALLWMCKLHLGNLLLQPLGGRASRPPVS